MYHYVDRGILSEEDKVLLGPTENGEFVKVNVRTMHRNRLPCRVIQPGQTATVSIPDCDRRTLRKVISIVIFTACTGKLDSA